MPCAYGKTSIGCIARTTTGSDASHIRASTVSISIRLAGGCRGAPSVSVVDDTIEGGVRRLRLRVTSPRQPWTTTITAKAEGRIQGVTVAGRDFDLAARPVEERTTWSLDYVALPEQGVELALDLVAGETLTLVSRTLRTGCQTYPERPSARDRPIPWRQAST